MNLATRIPKLAIAALAVIIAVAVVTIVAQEAWNGLVKTDMASIGATRDVSQSKVIPAPVVPFGGDIKRNASESTAWWPPEIAPPKGAPNILLVLIDDEGFGAPSTCHVNVRLKTFIMPNLFRKPKRVEYEWSSPD